MTLSEEQTKKIKEQLLEQIEKGFPDDRKDYAKKQIELMNAEELEEFLKQNNLTSQNTNHEKQKCIFCSIIEGNIPSYKIAENETSLAILDIRPASKGHVLIVPKKHIDSEKKLSYQTKNFAGKVSKKIVSALNPKKVEKINTNFFGHEVINLVPIYEDVKPKELGTQREEAGESELKNMYDKLKIKPKKKQVKNQPKTQKTKKVEKLLKALKRIP